MIVYTHACNPHSLDTPLLFSDPHCSDPRHQAFRHRCLTLVIASSSLAFALVVPDISIVFQLMGGTAGAFTCFIIPAAAAWRLRERVPQMRSAAGRLACICLFVTGMLVGVLSTAVTIDSLFDPPLPPFDPCNATTSPFGPGWNTTLLAASGGGYVRSTLGHSFVG